MPSITSAVQNATNNVLATGGATPTTTAQAALAPNSWVGAADNSLAVADVYSPPGGASVITDIENLFQKFDFSITDVLKGGASIAVNLPDVGSLIASAASAASSLTQGSLLSRLMQASSVTKSALSQLSSTALGGISSTIGVSINSGQIYAQINNVAQQVSATDVSDVTAVGNLINTLSGQPTPVFSLDDQDSKVGLAVGLINDSASYGVQNSYSSLITTVSGTDMVSRVTSGVLPSVITYSDTASLSSIGQTMGDKATYAFNPNVLGDFSSSYSLPTTTSIGSGTDYSAYFDDLTAAYSNIDSTWTTQARLTNVTQEDGSVTQVADNAFNLNTVMNGSTDFQTVIQQGVQTTPTRADKVMALASIVPQSTVAGQLASQFPLTVFSGNSQATSATQDPLTVSSSTPSLALPTGYAGVAPNTGQIYADLNAASRSSNANAAVNGIVYN